jgi:hypothetical protein
MSKPTFNIAFSISIAGFLEVPADSAAEAKEMVEDVLAWEGLPDYLDPATGEIEINYCERGPSALEQLAQEAE